MTNEPGRRQSSEVNNPNRPTSARHVRTHIRSHGTKLDRNIRDYGRGHRPTPTQAKSPARANTASGATIVNGLIRLQASHENTHIERTQQP